MQREVMKRAWELKRAGWAPTIAECMRAAWSEVKTGILIDLSPEPIKPAPLPRPESETIETTWRAWWLGWLATAG
jgi:hypothetical protein